MKNDVSKIVQAIGGKDNITSVTHCVTRLRFILKDEGQVDEAALDQIDLVKGQFSANGQYQVIIGPGIVDKVYDELVSQTGAAAVSKEEAKEQAAQDLNPLQKTIYKLQYLLIMAFWINSRSLLLFNNLLLKQIINFSFLTKRFINHSPMRLQKIFLDNAFCKNINVASQFII